MEKKIRFDGIMVFAVLHMLTILPISFIMINYGSYTKYINILIFGILIFSCSVGVIYRKKIANNLLLLWDVLIFIGFLIANIAGTPLIIRKYHHYGLPLKGLFLLLISLLIMIFSLSSIYYFTRPKVREHFK